MIDDEMLLRRSRLLETLCLKLYHRSTLRQIDQHVRGCEVGRLLFTAPEAGHRGVRTFEGTVLLVFREEVVGDLTAKMLAFHALAEGLWSEGKGITTHTGDLLAEEFLRFQSVAKITEEGFSASCITHFVSHWVLRVDGIGFGVYPARAFSPEHIP